MEVTIDADKLFAALSAQNRNMTAQDQFYLEALRQMKAGESWKEEDSELPAISPPVVVYLGERTLPAPFKQINGEFKREESFYKGHLGLWIPGFYSRIREIDNILDFVTKRVSEVYGQNWMDLGRNNYQVLSRGIPCIEITTGFIIKLKLLGEDGTDRRDFGDFDRFCGDIGTLEKVTNTLINAGVDAAVQAGRLKANPASKTCLLPK